MPEERLEVSYGVKELLAKIATDIVAIDVKLDMKADKADVVALQTRMDAMERVDAIRETIYKSSKRTIGLLATLGGGVIVFIAEKIITGR